MNVEAPIVKSPVIKNDVNVEPAQVHVNVPPLDTPRIEVNIPPQAAPDVVVNIPERPTIRKAVVNHNDGTSSVITVHYNKDD